MMRLCYAGPFDINIVNLINIPTLLCFLSQAGLHIDDGLSHV